ncbi:helix-turn-helix domain-containing protein [Novispirillum sp. DQ9]|uniref:helix-turn-helix domain-containing protein n=1 Tax=Novispirillum sp. DQ9 TaxID=3398612 RepID=UPI003C79C723
MSIICEAATSSLLTPKEVASILRVSEKTLKNWRSLRLGPPFIKVGGVVRYRRRSVDRWLEQIPEARRQRQRR